MKKILVIGALGQIGSELTAAFNEKYGNENVIVADVAEDRNNLYAGNAFEKMDVTDSASIEAAIRRHRIDTIVNLAAILSATGEKNPDLAWKINIDGLLNVIRLGIKYRLDRVMVPSSIAVFGPQSVLYDTPQETVLVPNTMYGVTKVVGELLGDYYFRKSGLDFRGIRYPGVISNKTMPGGGTTDYAVEIFYEAVKNKKYTCFLSPESCLPMIYMPDCIRATLTLLEADRGKLRHCGNYNVGAMSFTPEILANEIKKHIPEFTIDYRPDFRREIARYWPASVDDSSARAEWGWTPEWNLERMVADMLQAIRAKDVKPG
ncbi:MAG: NAD-dependent epimerase/dehydratase family protein [Prevotellaceae bacterium]|jgi:nucleoside-diphosphate-sugar epimerase|nr:NAD-dependent epimerase/dehydratase family protein [Prevotellaceae bacterium]